MTDWAIEDQWYPMFEYSLVVRYTSYGVGGCHGFSSCFQNEEVLGALQVEVL